MYEKLDIIPECELPDDDVPVTRTDPKPPTNASLLATDLFQFRHGVSPRTQFPAVDGHRAPFTSVRNVRTASPPATNRTPRTPMATRAPVAVLNNNYAMGGSFQSAMHVHDQEQTAFTAAHAESNQCHATAPMAYMHGMSVEPPQQGQSGGRGSRCSEEAIEIKWASIDARRKHVESHHALEKLAHAKIQDLSRQKLHSSPNPNNSGTPSNSRLNMVACTQAVSKRSMVSNMPATRNPPVRYEPRVVQRDEFGSRDDETNVFASIPSSSIVSFSIQASLLGHDRQEGDTRHEGLSEQQAKRQHTSHIRVKTESMATIATTDTFDTLDSHTSPPVQPGWFQQLKSLCFPTPTFWKVH
jgi:hypothetical protein